MTLAEFYAARLDEAEAEALAASPGPWHLSAEDDEVLAVDDITVADVFALSGNQQRATARHIARHDPARVIREVQAGRKILADYEGTRAITGDNDEYVAGLSAALSALASVYSDHPDWDEARRES